MQHCANCRVRLKKHHHIFGNVITQLVNMVNIITPDTENFTGGIAWFSNITVFIKTPLMIQLRNIIIRVE